MPALANKSYFVLKKRLLFYCTLLLSTDSQRKFLVGAKPSWACSLKWFIPSAVQLRDLPERLQILPKENRDADMLLERDELTKPERTWQCAGSNLFVQFSKRSAQEPKYNSKSERWRQARPPTRMLDLVPLVVHCLEKRTCLTSDEPSTQPCSLPPVQRRT